MHSCFGSNYIEHISHLHMDGAYERFPSLHVEHPHPADMTSEVSLANKIGQNQLIESRRKNIGRISCCREGGHQVLGNNYVTNPQSWKHDFAEGPDVDHPRLRVEPLKRGNRTASEPVLAVVVVFDDPSAGANRPIEEKHTARGTHRHAHRILVGWRDIYSARVATVTNRLRYLHALMIHRNRDKMSPSRDECLACAGITRFLDPHAVFRIH